LASQTVLAYQKVLNVYAAEETFREFCLSVQKKILHLSIGVGDFSACKFVLSQHRSIGNCNSMKNCTSIV